MSLGERMKQLRKRSGLSQEKVAEFVGVSRQAVTKWEANQSAPSTANLFKLAEVFGTTVDALLSPHEDEKPSPAEPIYDLYKMEAEKETEERRGKVKQNLLLALAVISGYMILYLAGRMFGTTGTPASVMGWLFGNAPEQFSYLYGWLLHQNMFWFAMAISTVPALIGKKHFSFTTLLGFAIGLLLGELFGYHPAGATYGHSHYGWLIWGGIFVFSVVMGIILEKMSKENLDLRSKKLWIWLAVFVVGILGMVLFVRANMPTSFR